MTTYEDLLMEADGNGLVAKEKSLRANKGRIKGNRIAIRKRMDETEKKCVMAEELGHHYTTSGNILDQAIDSNRKQEYRARLWAYDRLIGLRGIVAAHISGCQSVSDVADYLQVTEDFLQEALICYRHKYGVYVKLDNYVIYFEPHIGVFDVNSDGDLMFS